MPFQVAKGMSATEQQLICHILCDNAKEKLVAAVRKAEEDASG